MSSVKMPLKNRKVIKYLFIKMHISVMSILFYHQMVLLLQIFHQLITCDKEENHRDRDSFAVGPAINILVRRNYLYEDAFEKLSPENGTDADYTFWCNFFIEILSANS